MSEIPTEAEVVSKLAIASAEPRQLDPANVYAVADMNVQVLELEPFLPNPRRMKGVVQFAQAASLEAYVLANGGGAGSSTQSGAAVTAWADLNTNRLTAVLNDHGRTEAGWADWRGVLQLVLTPSWRKWIENEGLQGQEDFFEFVDDRQADFTDPAGADMLELVKSFHAVSSAVFDRAIRLDNGQVQLQYTESVSATAGQKRDMTIPERFSLALQPFEGGPAYRLAARLRYRINGGNLRIGYVLDRPDDVLRDAFKAVVDHFADATSILVYYGVPRSS